MRGERAQGVRGCRGFIFCSITDLARVEGVLRRVRVDERREVALHVVAQARLAIGGGRDGRGEVHGAAPLCAMSESLETALLEHGLNLGEAGQGDESGVGTRGESEGETYPFAHPSTRVRARAHTPQEGRVW